VLPDVDGLEVTRHIRESSLVPIIVVSARSDEDEQVEAFDCGANDFVPKPFRERELLARVRAALRSSAGQNDSPEPLSAGNLRLDPVERRLFGEDIEVKLTPTEFKILAVMFRSAGRVVTHQQLLRTVWGNAYLKEVQYLRVYMKQLRHKIEREPARPKYLLTASGVGYRLKVDP
jgi:two-component system KDP operon response regulator KdpE